VERPEETAVPTGWSSVKDFAGHAVRVLIVVAATAAVGVTPAAATVEPGLVAQWNFDEGAGQVAHDSGPFGLDGVLGLTSQADSADPTWIAGSSGGSALRFNEASSVRLPDSPKFAPQHLTIEAVARADHSPGRYRYLVSRGGTGCWSASYGLYSAPSGGLAFYVFDGSHYVLSPTARRRDVWNSEWHQLKGVFDGSTLRLFVDGREVGDPMVAPLRIDYGIPHSEALLGQYAGDCPLGFVGDLDSVRILSDPDVPPGAPGAPALPPLPAAAPGQTLPAQSPETAPEQAPGESKPASKPAKSACTVRLSRRTIVAGRRAIITARLVNAPRRSKLTLSARRGSSRKSVATARLSRSGHARLVLKAQRAGRLTVGVIGHSGCAPAQLHVSK
jgi:concanavalin A-like lectin/glucanase superfamily protein